MFKSTYLRVSIFSVLSSSHNLYFKFNVWCKSLGSGNTNTEQMLPSSDASTPPEYQNGINFQFGNFMTLRRGPTMGGGARVIWRVTFERTSRRKRFHHEVWWTIIIFCSVVNLVSCSRATQHHSWMSLSQNLIKDFLFSSVRSHSSSHIVFANKGGDGSRYPASGGIYSLHSRARETSLGRRVEVVVPRPGRWSRQAIEHSTTCETDGPIQLASYSHSSYELSSCMNQYF